MKSWIDSISNVAVCTLRQHEASPSGHLMMETAVGALISFWPRLILRVYPLQLTPNLWLYDQQERIQAAFNTPGLPPRNTHVSTKPRCFLLSLFIGSCWKRKRAPIKLCRRMLCLQCIIHAETERDGWRERKWTHCPSWRTPPLYSRNLSTYLLVKSY